MTTKQEIILNAVRENPGINTFQLHKRYMGGFAHGSHKFTYDSVNRMIRGNSKRFPLLRVGPSVNGRGGGLYPA